MRATWATPRRSPPLQTASRPTATEATPAGSDTVAVTRPVRGSMRVRELPTWLATQTASGPKATVVGWRPTATVTSDGSGPVAGGS